MSDVHITIAYILKGDQAARAKDYVLYGLGQEKLQIAHLERRATERGESIEEDQQIQVRKWWLASQRFEHLTVVNVGSATGLSTREMASDSDNMPIYDYNFTPFSACVHSTWQHVGRFNVSPCDDPLHGGHLLPVTPELESSSWELVVAARTLKHTLQEVDGFTRVALPFEAMRVIKAMRDLNAS